MIKLALCDDRDCKQRRRQGHSVVTFIQKGRCANESSSGKVIRISTWPVDDNQTGRWLSLSTTVTTDEVENDFIHS